MAWAVGANSTNSVFSKSSSSSEYYNLYARCVQGNELVYSDFLDNYNGTVTSNNTGHMWQQGAAGPMKWGLALNYCESLSLGGYSDWRLPNIRELEYITDETKYYPAINTTFFPAFPGWDLWSSTTFFFDPTYAWFIHLTSGNALYLMGGDFTGAKSDEAYVRCVRGGKTRIDDGEIVINPASYGFGIVDFLSSAEKVFTVTNIGNVTVNISQMTKPSPPFSLASDGCSGISILPSGNCSLTAVFNPQAKGIYEDSIIITTSDAENLEVKVAIVGSTVPYLSDTGKTNCFDNSGNAIDCPPPGNTLAQDGSYIIHPPSYMVNGNGMVMDNNTGLMWQQDAGTQTYNWYKASGNLHKRYNSRSVNVCGSLTISGYTDWRLPTRKELAGIVNYGKIHPAIDLAAFPSALPLPFWSSDSAAGITGLAWFVDFLDGSSDVYVNDLELHVRCVRGKGLVYGDFRDNNNGTVSDLGTELMWQKSAAGVDETAALSYCEGLTRAGYTDWRTPNIRELESITEETRNKPPLNPVIFPFSVSNYDHVYFWSSSPSSSSSKEKWHIDLINNRIHDTIDFNTRLVCDMGLAVCGSFVQCVRGGTGAPEMPGGLQGLVKDSSTSQSLSNVTVTVTKFNTQSTVTDSYGNYKITEIAIGAFTATFSKSGYITQIVNGTLSSGQILTLDIQLTPISPLTISITSPQNNAVFNSTPIAATGNVSNNADVSVNGIIASRSGNVFTASVPLVEGPNTITATATDQYGQIASQNIAVTLVLPKPPQISNISVNNITTDSAVISWTTDQHTDSLVEYGETTAYGNTASDAGLVTSHTITLNNLNPDKTYHFKVTSKNANGYSSSSGDNTFSTLKFKATTIGDYGNVTVMEVKGNYDSKNPDDTINYFPRQEIAKEFYKNHQDQYDFFVIFTNFDFALPQAGAKAYYLEVKNEIQGIGKQILDDSSQYGSSSKLQGIIEMGNLSKLASTPSDPKFEEAIDTLAHEQMHRWGSSVNFKDPNNIISSGLIGKDGVHWSYLLDTDGSLMYGNDWKDNGNGTFTSVSSAKYYSPLDLYLMGFNDKTQVPQMLLIDNPNVDKTKIPEIGATISGTAQYVTMDNIIAAEGERIPNASSSQKAFKTAFILLTSPGTYTGNELNGIENIRNAWAGRFAGLTNGKGTITEVTPSLTVAISSPSNNETISKPYVTVKGAIINNTGKETGVTVNGMPATVSGSQFIANHVPLTEGINTITVSATDTAGNTATPSINVNAVTTGNYIRLVSNIESGIAPLEVSLRIDGSFSVTSSNLHISAPTQAEVLSSSPEEYRLKFIADGIYFVTVSSTGPDDVVYEDTVTIVVLNKNQLDTLLKGKWEGMKGALRNKNTEEALGYFIGSSKNRFGRMFDALKDQLPAIMNTFIEFNIVDVYENLAEYEIIANENGVLYSYPGLLVKDGTGIWKFRDF